jgi:amino acid transporter
MSGLAVVAIALVEAMVCVAVVVFFRTTAADGNAWRTLVAPVLAFIGLVLGIYLLISHFGLLAGTSAEGVDPTKELFGLNATGWTLVALPFAMFIIGTIIGLLRKRSENVDAVEDLVH